MAATLVEQIYDNLFDMIIQKQLKPGDRLPAENTLCEMYSVSRNTVRAALNKLCTLGFAETRHGGGTYVKEVDSNVYLNFFVPALLTHNFDLLEMMQLRKAIETEAARLAAERASEEDIAALKALLEKCEGENAKMDMWELAAANTEFHTMVSKISKSRMMETLMDIIGRMIRPEMQEFLVRQGESRDSGFYHRSIYECIAMHKAEEAAFFMERHMASLIERVKRDLSLTIQKESEENGHD